MKLFIILIATVFVVEAINDAVLWSQFKKDYSSTYKSLLEEKVRFSIFQSNLRTIEAHNEKYERGEETYFLKITQFADLNDNEFEAIYLNYHDTEITNTEIFKLGEDDYVPEAIDWREKGAVLPVKNQGRCGSCWAFSATGALEAQNAIKNDIKLSLSEEELVECSRDNHGCNGGNMMRAFTYVKENGISTEESYPYVASNGETKDCKPRQDSGIVVLGYMAVLTTEADLKEAVGTAGPVSVSINGKDIKLYGGGVFNNPSCNKTLNHGVLAVGYGSEGDLDYWIVKNSWGENWGDEGYIKMARNRDQQCGISLRNSYPIVL